MKNDFPLVYGLKRKNLEKRLESQSGGAFSVIAEYFLKKGAVIYATGFDDKLNVEYMRITSESDLRKVKGSKYVRTNLNDTYNNVLADLDETREVLFIGSACYVAGLKKVVERHLNADLLYTVDFICHGTPSHQVYKDYLQFIEKKRKKKVVAFDFRYKDVVRGGWKKHVEKIKYKDGTTEVTRIYTDLFYSNLILRPCCGNCQYASTERIADFTIGDYWGVEKHFPEFFDNAGVSLVFVNTPRAKKIFEHIQDECDIVESTTEKCMQKNLREPTTIPPNRLAYWKCLKKHGFESALRRFTNYGALYRFKYNTPRKIKQMVKKIIGRE